MKLFSFSTAAFCDDQLVEMAGFSHRSQPFKKRVNWYPFEEWTILVWLYARNRRHAIKQLLKAGRNDVRDLDDGRRCETPKCMGALN